MESKSLSSIVFSLNSLPFKNDVIAADGIFDSVTTAPVATVTDAPTTSPTASPTAPVSVSVPATPGNNGDNGQGNGSNNGQGKNEGLVEGNNGQGNNGQGNNGQNNGQEIGDGVETSGGDNTDAIEDRGGILLNADEGDGLAAGPIVGIVVAGAVFLLCCIVLFGRRRRSDEEGKPLEEVEGGSYQDTEGTPDLQFANLDAMADTGDAASDTWSPTGQSRSVVQFDPSAGQARRIDDSSSRRSSGVVGAEVEQICSAIDSGNWDEVYTLASQLAEREDQSTLSSAGKQKANRILPSIDRHPRQGLSAEDRERTRTLDELTQNADWTGLAVTAALYAGESTATTSAPKRSIMDIVKGKPVTSRAAANAASVDSILRPTGKAPTDGQSNLLAALSFESDDNAPVRSGKTDNTAWQAKSLGFGIFGSNQPTTPDRAGSTATAGSGMSSKLGSLKSDIDRAVDAGDWDRVLLLSSQVEADQSFRDNMAQLASTAQSTVPSTAEGNLSLDEQLDRAIYHGDWAMVTQFANRIIEQRGSEPVTSDSTALVPVSRSVGMGSVDTSDSLAGKRQTIEKLIQAKSYKGVAIMSGLYSLDAGHPPGAGSSESGQSWMGLFGSPPASTTAPSNDSGQSSWMGILNLASSTDDTPTHPRDQPVQPSPPALMGREEVQLRSSGVPPQLKAATPLLDEASSTGRSLVPIAELRPAGGTTPLPPTPRPPGETPASLHGAKQLIPYWQDKEKQASHDDEDDSAYM